MVAVGFKSSLLLKLVILLMLAMLLSYSSAAAEETITVLRSLAYQGKNSISGAKLANGKKDVTVSDITFCMRFNYKKDKPLIIIEDERIGENDNVNFTLFVIEAKYPLTFFVFGYPRAKGSFKSWIIRNPDNPDFSWAFSKWTHMCFSYEKKLGLGRLIIDGKLTNVNLPDSDYTEVKIPTDFLSKVYLGKCNGPWDWCSGPEGQQLSDFNIWSRALSQKEMEDWTTCSSMLQGDLVNWSSAKFDLFNMSADIQPFSYLCKPPRPGHVIFPEKRNFTYQQSFCQKMRGIPTVVKNNETQVQLGGQIKQFLAPCGYDFYAGWWDIPKEGTYSSVVTSEPLLPSKFSPWNLGEPNGDTLENCAVVQSAVGVWNDVGCGAKVCSFCELETYPDVQIRGLCSWSMFDAIYTWTRSMVNNRYNFNGYGNSKLIWDSISNMWKLEIFNAPLIYATVNEVEYPFGTHLWKLYGDYCYGTNVTEIYLNVNACNTSEYNCLDGQCVMMDQLCDGKVDCSDKTDEIGCKIFTTDASYLKDVPPAPQEGNKEKVKISIDILSILDIKEVENLISLQLLLSLSWLDKRLTMFNLKNDKDINTLTPSFRSSIWIPEVVFYNTQEKLESLNDEKAFATITRNGTYYMNSRDNLQNSYIFSGAENPITISRVYNAEFICQFNMATFPFDTQLCYIILIMKGNTAKFIEMKSDMLNYLGPVDLTQYFVKNMSMSEQTVFPNTTCVRVDIVFGRRILGTMLTAYLPTILICIVSFSTNYYKSFFFEANVSVNLTCLLVLTTLFISVCQSMTKTSYIKMIDIWFIFNLCIPFAEVLLHTFIDNMRDDEGREVNDHGKKQATNKDKEKGKSSVTTMYPAELNSIHDNVEVNARKDLYKSIAKTNANPVKIQIAMKIVDTGMPVLFIIFIVVYFGMGAYFYYQ